MNPYLEITVRAVGAFLGVVFITRLVGKSQVNNLTVTDFVNGIVIGSIAGMLATDLTSNAIYHVFGLAVFTLLTIALEYSSLKIRPARKILEGEPTIIIHNGKILEKNMAKLLYNIDDLMMQLREKGNFNISDVEFAISEPNGELSVLPKSHKRPVTPEDLKISTKYEGVPSELIIDGKIIQQNLKQNNLDEEWLFKELERKGVKRLDEVMYASLDTDGNLYVDTKRDTLDHLTDVTDKDSEEWKQ